MSARLIYHYAAGARAPRFHTIPADSRILGAVSRSGAPTVYVDVPAAATKAPAVLKAMFVGTGWEFDPEGLDYVGTVQDGELVWHVYAAIV